MKKGKSKRGSKGTSRLLALAGPAVGATAFNGPLRMPVRTTDADTTVVRLSYAFDIATSLGGAILYGLTNNPSASTEWSGYVTLYEEYRVLGTTHSWIPARTDYINAASAGPLLFRPVVFAVDRNAGISVPLSVASAWQKSNAVAINIQKPHRTEIRAGSAQEMLFLTTASPAATWQWTMTAQSLDASTFYGTVFTEYFVQFRNRA